MEKKERLAGSFFGRRLPELVNRVELGPSHTERKLLNHGPKGRFTVHSLKRSHIESFLATKPPSSALALRIRRLTRDATAVDIDVGKDASSPKARAAAGPKTFAETARAHEAAMRQSKLALALSLGVRAVQLMVSVGSEPLVGGRLDGSRLGVSFGVNFL